jgi:hypothetical protein
MITTTLVNTQTSSTIPQRNATVCPFCDCTKYIRYEIFDDTVGQVITLYDDIYRYKNLAGINIYNQPASLKYRAVACYCDQCYVSFDVNKSLGIL